MSPSQARILIADEESLIRLHLREMLTNLGYDVVADASDAELAFDLVNKIRPDLLLVDFNLTNFDQKTTSKSILEPRVAPVVILLDPVHIDLISLAAGAGASGCLVKPIRESDLTPVIEIALNQFARRQNLEQKVSDLEEALETRKLVERAKGVLMEAYGLSESEAFNRMRRTSMDNRRSMREVSEAILLSQEVQTK